MATVDISTYWLCDRPGYERLSALTIECGSLALEAQESVTVSLASTSISINPAGDEMGLYTSSSFANANDLIDYVIWGDRTGSTREPTAVEAGRGWHLDARRSCHRFFF